MNGFTRFDIEDIKKAFQEINGHTLKNTNVKLDHLDKKLGTIIDLLSDIKKLLEENSSNCQQ